MRGASVLEVTWVGGGEKNRMGAREKGDVKTFREIVKQ
jgi:hypothetical protein